MLKGREVKLRPLGLRYVSPTCALLKWVNMVSPATTTMRCATVELPRPLNPSVVSVTNVILDEEDD